MRSLVLLLLFAAAAACSEGSPVPSNPDGGSPDVGAAPDADLPGADAGPPGVDASSLDASSPGPDASLPDAGGCSLPSPLPALTVATETGAVRGTVNARTLSFRGIPFVAPPTGELRWRAPAPATCWPGILEAKAFGPSCPQLDANGAVFGSEDCLTLNVWTPQPAAAAPVPVLVFLHGGSNVSGGSGVTTYGLPFYDGDYLSGAGGVVLVTLNYRLGVFGFLAEPNLSDPVTGSVGNYGLLDQLAALQWIQRNIAAFGGDPARVTVFGQSAGAFDTCALISSPLSAGLFQGAMMMSGGCGAGERWWAENTGTTVAGRVGCTQGVAACLRAKSAAELVGATTFAETYSGGFYYPIVDGHVLPAQPQARIESGLHQPVSAIVGNTSEEMTQFIKAYVPQAITTEAEFQATILNGFGPKLSSDVLAQYPLADYASPQKALEAVYADKAFVCPSRRAARALALHSAKTWRYVFSRAYDLPAMHVWGAAHGYDLFFFFHTQPFANPAWVTTEEVALADQMSRRLWALAKTGAPDVPGDPAWPAYVGTLDPALDFDVPVSVLTGVRTAQCDFWDLHP